MLSKLATRSLSSTAAVSGRPVVLVDAARTPFVRSNQEYDGIWAYDLQREAISGLLKRNPKVDPAKIDRVVCGTVIQDVSTSNISREAALAAGIPTNVPCNTVTLACISSNVAMSDCAADIANGNADLCIAGGVDVMSDVPIRWPRKTRSWLLKHGQKVKGLGGKRGLFAALNHWKGSKLSMIGVEAPAVSEFSTGETMGHSADRLCAAFGVSRQDQDEFAFRSHTLAEKATKEGKLKDVLKVFVPGRELPVSRDMGVKPDLKKSQSLKAAFVKPHGTVTAANASYLTDGASACLLASEDKAKELGLPMISYLKDSIYVAQDPVDELLLGPAYAIKAMLEKHNLTIDDVDVFEMHEAFAGQVLSCRKALASDKFCQEKMGLKKAVGLIPMEKLNLWGGSVSIGHPFGATGVRLASHASHRLKEENGKVAVIAACAAGGHAYGGLVTRHPSY